MKLRRAGNGLNKSIVFKRCFFAFLVLAWSLVIFLYSAKPADESTAQSYRVGKLFGSIFVPGFYNWTEDAKTEFASKVDYPVRKTAHATEYAILGFLTSCLAFCFDNSLLVRTPMTLELLSLEEERKRIYKLKKRIILMLSALSLAFCVFYAATDEVHQLFVPGRAGKITDVLIDSAGAFVAVSICYLIKKIRVKS